VGKFNVKKNKVKRIFAKLIRDGKWHVAVEDGRTTFFPCMHYGWGGRQNQVPTRLVWGVARGPFSGLIFTKTHKICGTCMNMSRNRETLKEAGYVT
jgi:hypothetical protein